MNFSLSALIPGFIFGTVGLFLLRHAKRNANITSALYALTLIIYPYFLENVFLLWGIGVGVCFLAYRFSGD